MTQCCLVFMSLKPSFFIEVASFTIFFLKDFAALATKMELCRHGSFHWELSWSFHCHFGAHGKSTASGESPAHRLWLDGSVLNRRPHGDETLGPLSSAHSMDASSQRKLRCAKKTIPFPKSALRTPKSVKPHDLFAGRNTWWSYFPFWAPKRTDPPALRWRRASDMTTSWHHQSSSRSLTHLLRLVVGQMHFLLRQPSKRPRVSKETTVVYGGVAFQPSANPSPITIERCTWCTLW